MRLGSSRDITGNGPAPQARSKRSRTEKRIIDFPVTVADASFLQLTPTPNSRTGLGTEEASSLEAQTQGSDECLVSINFAQPRMNQSLFMETIHYYISSFTRNAKTSQKPQYATC